MARRKKIGRACPPGQSAPWRNWYAGKRPVLVFGLKFVSIVALLYLVSLASIWDRVQEVHLDALTRLAHRLLHFFGEDSQRTGATLWSLKYSVTVTSESAGSQFAWFLGAAMLAFPARWSRKVLGLLAGVALLAALNVVRVGSLYAVGVHAPAAFAPLHEDGWPGILVLITLGIMAIWIGWCRRAEQVEVHAAS